MKKSISYTKYKIYYIIKYEDVNGIFETNTNLYNFMKHKRETDFMRNVYRNIFIDLHESLK